MAIADSADALALLRKAAIKRINDVLQPGLGENPIQDAPGADNGPEATASFIVGASTAFYDAYREQNKLDDTAASRERYAELLRSGFDQAAGEARQVPGAVATADFDRTCELVVKGLREFATVAYSQPGGPMPLPDPV